MRSLCRHRWPAAVLLGLVLGLGGCAKGTDDLDQWVQEVLSRPGGRIKPVPEIKPYEAYAYQAGAIGATDPFEPFYEIRQAEELEEVVDSVLSAEMEREINNRNREELEQFELDSLRMVGTLDDDRENWAIILDPDGVVHRIKVGNYLGRNIGKVIYIAEDRIDLREIVRSEQGRWEERQAAITLVEQ